jgi:hypothetical protein
MSPVHCLTAPVQNLKLWLINDDSQGREWNTISGLTIVVTPLRLAGVDPWLVHRDLRPDRSSVR